MWRRKGEESGLREVKPGKASLTAAMWSMRVWSRAAPEKQALVRDFWIWILKKTFLQDFQSPNLGDYITVVASLSETDRAWDQKQFQGKRQMLSIQESETPVVSLHGVAAG